MRHVSDDISITPHHHHRNKRLYQPDITAYFSPQGDAVVESEQDDLQQRGRGPNSRAQHHQHQHHASAGSTTPASVRRHHGHDHDHYDSFSSSSLPSPGFPQLPHTVQVDLLSVGMRVRKSVPEGYKTATKPSLLPSIQTTLSRPRPDTVKPPRDPLDSTVQHQRELLPFCGLQKIGGYAEQPVTNIHLYTASGAGYGDDNAVPMFTLPAESFIQPFSSQSSGSTSSSTSSLASYPNPLNPQKRSWHDEDDVRVKFSDGYIFKMEMRGADDEVPVSPLSETPIAKGIMRNFAQPKTRRPVAARIMSDQGMGGKDTDAEVEDPGAQGKGDFGEADFLRWGGEIQMGGL